MTSQGCDQRKEFVTGSLEVHPGLFDVRCRYLRTTSLSGSNASDWPHHGCCRRHHGHLITYTGRQWNVCVLSVKCVCVGGGGGRGWKWGGGGGGESEVINQDFGHQSILSPNVLQAFQSAMLFSYTFLIPNKSFFSG